MKTIELSRGLEAMVDDEDYQWLSQFRWHAHKAGNGWYARTYLGGGRKYGIKKRMHELLVDRPNGARIDHRDRNGLNNQKSNLRICRHVENLWNTGLKAGRVPKSGFKGVTAHVSHGRMIGWRARLGVEGRVVFKSGFRNAVDAARAYDDLVIAHRGEFGITNHSLGLL